MRSASPQHLAPASGPWPLHDSASTRALEQQALAASPPPPLMARAGLAVARLGRALAPRASRTLVLAGPGNNGGDGLVAARLLHTARHPVQVRLLGDPACLPPDAAQALRAAAAAGVEIQPFDAATPLRCSPQDLLIDALLGLGSRRAPEGPLAQAIALANASPACLLAVDLPSGLHPDTGALLGSEAIRAQATLALLSIKPGCVTAQGREHCGSLWWDALGLDLRQAPASAWLAGPPARPPRPHSAHKGRFGDVWVLGGSPGMEGALQLAASAALAAGAGRVHACSLAPQGTPGLTRPELMQRGPREALQGPVLAHAVLVAGCGGGPEIAALLPGLLDGSQRLLLDADALNAIAARPALQAALAARGRAGWQTVLTPHPLEAGRLLGCSAAVIQADRWAAARTLASRYGATVVLKGSGSLVASPGQPTLANPSGNAALGTAGTGDVLAGYLGGLWAQGLSAHAAAQAAAWWHGHAADAWREQGASGPLRAADLIERLAAL